MGRPSIPAQPDFLIQLRRTQHAVRTRLDADLAATGLTLPQYTVMAVLERERELSGSDLAREAGLTAQTMNVLVQGLAGMGLLRRVRHPEHGRILLASLTPAGGRAPQPGAGVAPAGRGPLLPPPPPAARQTAVRRPQGLEGGAGPAAGASSTSAR